MADTDKATLKKIGVLIDTLRDLQAKTYDVTEEIQRLLAGDAGIGAKLKQVEQAWQLAWSSRYHADYVPNYTQDRAHIKRLLKTFTVAELQDRMIVYIKSQDPFYVSRRHPFAVFVASVNTHVEPPPVNEHQLSQKTTEVLAGLGAFVEHEP